MVHLLMYFWSIILDQSSFLEKVLIHCYYSYGGDSLKCKVQSPMIIHHCLFYVYFFFQGAKSCINAKKKKKKKKID